VKKTLYKYQIIGAYALSSHKYYLLGDRPGLGKTAQAIEALRQVGAHKFLIICPANAKIHWQKEISYWQPRLSLSLKIMDHLFERPQKHESIICSFNYATNQCTNLTKNHFWDAIIIDESHLLKSIEALRAKAIVGVNGLIHRTKRMWFLSGTPAPNHAGELWVILYVTGATTLTYGNFVRQYCTTRPDPHSRHYGFIITGTNIDKIPELKKMLSKIMLRRDLKDAMIELPPLTYGQTTVQASDVDLEEHEGFFEYFFPANREMALHTKLKLERNRITDLFNNVGRRNTGADVGALTAIADSVSTIRRLLGLQKCENVINMVTEELTANKYEKIVIFCVHRDVVKTLREGFMHAGFRPVTLYGGTPAEKRQHNIDKFTNRKNHRVFIGNIQSAGIAIDLTAACQMLFVEQDWVPGNNAQAIMRCHRIGQKHPVHVRFVSIKGSLDTKISQILRRKTWALTRIFEENNLQAMENRYTT